MDRLAQLVDISSLTTEADLLTLSGKSTSIRTGTTVGLGVLSGWAIMTVGELVLKGVETIRIRRTLFGASTVVRNLRLKQKSPSLDDQTIRNLLELQR